MKDSLEVDKLGLTAPSAASACRLKLASLAAKLRSNQMGSPPVPQRAAAKAAHKRILQCLEEEQRPLKRIRVRGAALCNSN